MDFRVKNKNASTQNSTYKFREFRLPKAHPWISDYLEEELLIITSIKISMPNTKCLFKIKSHATNEDEHINSLL